MVTIRFFAAAKAATGVPTMEVIAVDMRQALEQAQDTYPKLASVLTKCSYLRNGVSCTDQTIKLNDEDILDVLPPFAGG